MITADIALFVLFILGILALLIWFVWHGLGSRRKIKTAIFDGIQGMSPKGLLHHDWLSNGWTDARYLLIALDSESSALLMAGAAISVFSPDPGAETVETSQIQVSEIISSEVVSKSRNGGIGGAVPVQTGDSSVLLGGLLNLKSESVSLNIGLRNLQNPVVRIPMPNLQVAEEWHTRIKILTECRKTA